MKHIRIWTMILYCTIWETNSIYLNAPRNSFCYSFSENVTSVLTAAETTLKQWQVMPGIWDMVRVLYETKRVAYRVVKLHNLNMQRMNAQMVKVVLRGVRTLLKIITSNSTVRLTFIYWEIWIIRNHHNDAFNVIKNY